MSIYEVLQTTGLPVAYGHFKSMQKPPFIVYLGGGQTTMSADNTWHYRNNQYQIEYYYTKKNEEAESNIEDVLLANGYNYDKSEDVYIDSEGIYVIYYSV